MAKVMINPFEVWQIYRKCTQEKIEQSVKEAWLYKQMDDLGFDVSPDKNPAVSVGWAIKFAQRYKVDLHGKSLMEVCAAIEKDNWARLINSEIDQFEYGVFMKHPINEIQSIFAYGETIQIAVCKCLINARIAGVI